MRTNLGKEGPGSDIPARAWVGVEGEEWARREEPDVGGGGCLRSRSGESTLESGRVAC
jgi:hypothetical protein